MERFSGFRLLVNLTLLILSIFLLIAAYQQFHGFVRMNIVKVVNEKSVYYPVYNSVEGKALFISHPVKSISSGSIERLVGNFSFINKGDLIGRIKSEGYTYDIIAPSNGLLVWKSFDKYFNSLQEIDNFKGDVSFKNTSVLTNKGSTACTIINNDMAFVKINSPEIASRLSISFYNSGNLVSSQRVFHSKDCSTFEVNVFLKYFIGKSKFTVFDGFKKGIKVDSNMVIKEGGNTGIFIVLNNVITFVPARIYDMENDKILAVINDSSNSVIVVTTPHFVENGEIFNE